MNRKLTISHLTSAGEERITDALVSGANSNFVRHALSLYWLCPLSNVDVSNVIDAHEVGIHTFEVTGGLLWRNSGTFRLRMERAA